jgi:hypothetical protein
VGLQRDPRADLAPTWWAASAILRDDAAANPQSITAPATDGVEAVKR